MPIGVVGGALLAGGAKALARPLEDLYLLGKGTAASKLARWKNNKNITGLYKKIDAVQKVKTIWQIDKEVKLMTFYYPSKVELDGRSVTVTSIAEIAPTGCRVVQGTVGQGKSIFLRYLCMRELALCKRIPIFLELRRIEKGKSLRSYLDEVMKAFGFEIDENLFDLYASSGKFVFLLDGFDELDSNLVTGVINELELLAQKYPSTQMLITSRPDSGIERSAHFRVCRLSPLTQEDHKSFLEKIVSDQNRVSVILKAVKASSTQIQQLLTTPLMLTLLVIVYKAQQSIPESLPDFYENLFQTLLTRHDATKPGFSRKRKSRLGDSELKKLFETFCFIAKQKNWLVLTEEQMSECVEIACKTSGIKCSNEGFCQDVTKVACLMQEEAFRYHFIHKSVIEFNAASFIRRSHDDLAIKFYSMINGKKWAEWAQELVFLSQIDKYRYSKYFFLPATHQMLNNFEISPIVTAVVISEQRLLEFLKRLVIELTIRREVPKKTHINLLKIESDQYAMQRLSSEIVNSIFRACSIGESDGAQYESQLTLVSENAEARRYSVDVGTWLTLSGRLEKMKDALNTGISGFIQELHDAEHYINLEESKEQLLTM